MKEALGRRSPRSRPVRRAAAAAVEALEARTLAADGIAAVAPPRLNAVAGVPLANAVVAAFTVTDPAGAPGTKWRALIDWGDGHDDALVAPVQAGSVFGFLGSHAYATAGTFPVKVMIAVPGSMLPDDNTVLTRAVVAAPVRDKAPGDFDGDGRTDQGLFLAATDQWVVLRSTAGFLTPAPVFGAAGDLPVVGDFDGLGHAEVGVYRPSTAQWIVLGPNGGHLLGTFGTPSQGDLPVPGDYDGIGRTEMAVFRPSTAQWIVQGPAGPRVLGTFGAADLFDIPVPGDYDGVGHTEMAVFRPSTGQWIVQGPAGPHVLGSFGATGLADVPVPGDYDGVGHTEMAVYRRSNGQWIVLGPGGGRALAVSPFRGPSPLDLPAGAPAGARVKLGAVGRPSALRRPGRPGIL